MLKYLSVETLPEHVSAGNHFIIAIFEFTHCFIGSANILGVFRIERKDLSYVEMTDCKPENALIRATIIPNENNLV